MYFCYLVPCKGASLKQADHSIWECFLYHVSVSQCTVYYWCFIPHQGASLKWADLSSNCARAAGLRDYLNHSVESLVLAWYISSSRVTDQPIFHIVADYAFDLSIKISRLCRCFILLFHTQVWYARPILRLIPEYSKMKETPACFSSIYSNKGFTTY